MFENFTFGAPSQSHHDREVFASPTDTTFPVPSPRIPSSFPFPDAGVDVIAYRLQKQSLSGEPLVDERFAAAGWGEKTATPFQVDDDEDGEMSYVTPRMSTSSAPLQPSDFPSRSPLACRRLQRQLNMQMQLSSSHIRDINTLVQDMITNSSQCRLYKPLPRCDISSAGPSPPPSRGRDMEVDTSKAGMVNTLFGSASQLEVDEGFHEGEDWDEFTLRRASTPSGIRKHHNMKFRRSADVIYINGQVKVRNKPRMRRRKPKPVPE